MGVTGAAGVVGVFGANVAVGAGVKVLTGVGDDAGAVGGAEGTATAGADGELHATSTTTAASMMNRLSMGSLTFLILRSPMMRVVYSRVRQALLNIYVFIAFGVFLLRLWR